MKNRVLAASGLPHNFDSHSRLASRQWSLAPIQNSGDPPCQIPDSSSCFGISEMNSNFGFLKSVTPIDHLAFLKAAINLTVADTGKLRKKRLPKIRHSFLNRLFFTI